MVLALWSACILFAVSDAPVTIEVRPAEVVLESAADALRLSVDFVLTSRPPRS